jgi:aldehyde:ferredoxin oxidoreductase
VSPEDLLLQSERVYNFQRMFNLKMGYGTREHDYPPYRAMGPVTVEEYESRANRYDEQLQQVVGADVADMSTQEKMTHLRTYREQQYESLVDAVYRRRGWDRTGVPSVDTVQRLGIDFPEVLSLIRDRAEE